MKKVQDLQGKIKAKKEKTALAKGEKMKSGDALRQNLRAAVAVTNRRHQYLLLFILSVNITLSVLT